MHFFYAPDIDIEAESYALNEKESHHILHVLRSKPGDNIQLTNGKGAVFHSEITDISKKVCRVRIISRLFSDHTGPNILLAIAPVKTADRLDFLLEKITECGVRTCALLLTQNSERRKVDVIKESQTMIAAIKQSGSPFLPELIPLTDFHSFIESKKETAAQKFICHCRESATLSLAKSVKPAEDVIICIGPEGDFTEEEVSFAEANGFISVHLSDRILRTETAAITAINCIQTIYQLAL